MLDFYIVIKCILWKNLPEKADVMRFLKEQRLKEKAIVSADILIVCGPGDTEV